MSGATSGGRWPVTALHVDLGSQKATPLSLALESYKIVKSMGKKQESRV